MLERLPRSRRNWALAIVGILVLLFAWKIRSVLNPLLVGYLVAYIALPLVQKVEQHGFSRRTAVNLTFVGGFLLATAVSFFLAVQTRNLAQDIMAAEPAPVELSEGVTDAKLQPHNLGDRLAERYEATQVWLEDLTGTEILPSSVGDQLREVDISQIRDRAQLFLKEHREGLVDAAGGVLGFLSRFVSRLFELSGWVFLVPLYAYYFLFELQRLHAFVRRYLPKRDRQQISDVMGKIGIVISSFFRGRLGVCLIKGLMLSTGLAVAGIPYAFLFGMVSGFLSLIPFFGPFIGFFSCSVVGLAFAERIGGIIPTGDNVGVIEVLLRTGIVFGAGELIEGYVLIPRVLGESLGLHPLVVLFAMFAGGSAFGVLGIVIALPVTASLVIVFQEFVLPALRNFADGDDDFIPG